MDLQKSAEELLPDAEAHLRHGRMRHVVYLREPYRGGSFAFQFAVEEAAVLFDRAVVPVLRNHICLAVSLHPHVYCEAGLIVMIRAGRNQPCFFRAP